MKYTEDYRENSFEIKVRTSTIRFGSVNENLLRSFLRLCLRVWRGREGKAWEKRNEQVEEIEENGR